MDEVRTYTCSNCGTTIETSAAPGATVTCANCGTPFTVPERGNGAAGEVRRGQPQDLPRGDAAGEPETPGEKPPPADSPAGVGYTVDSDAVAPTVGRDPSVMAGQEITPIGAGTDAAPTAADLIHEPLKYGVGIPAGQGEPVIVPPNRVVVTPPQAEARGGPPGMAMTSRSPMMLAGAAVGCCLLLGLLGAACLVLQISGGLLTR